MLSTIICAGACSNWIYIVYVSWVTVAWHFRWITSVLTISELAVAGGIVVLSGNQGNLSFQAKSV